MAENRYANLAAHQIEHERLRRRVRQMARDIDAGRLGVNEIRLFVAEWLDGHVRTSDRDFGDYLRRCQFARRDRQR